ncbi:MAG: efflux RND transporter periplasmic adaptor subunit [Thermodesulfobacteriota bacterium]
MSDSSKKRIFKVLLPVLILAGGAGVTAVLVMSRPSPTRQERVDAGALVHVMAVAKGSKKVTVFGTGTVEAAREVTVIPQVSGRVTSLSAALVSGGFFRTGETLFEIERTDYRLAVERAEAARAAAEYELAKIESQARVARTEWERLGMEAPAGPNPLVIFEPQLKDARAALKSAAAEVEQARVNLARTVIRAPFNCRVRSEEVELGQYVRAGTGVAELAGTDNAEITVPLALDELEWFSVPRQGRPAGSKAEVVLRTNGTERRWEGRVARSVGEVGTKDRMMRVVVTVEDPYGLKRKSAGGAAGATLPLGAFVEVDIEGRELDGVVTIPRTALRDDSTVWTVGEDSTLHIRKIRPVRIEREEVIVSEGLGDGELVILTTLSGAAEGMKLRVVGGDEDGGSE